MQLKFKRCYRAFYVLLASFALVANPAWAMRVSPMVVEMESSGSNSVARIEVQNINQGKLAFETRVYRVDIAEDGTMTETPADDEFLIFPPQGALPAGGRQVVRVQWMGDPEIPASRAYYVSVEQLPVAFTPGDADGLGAQVQVLYNMRALAVVAPPGAKPAVTATSATAVSTELPAPEGSEAATVRAEAVEIVLSNEGRRHAMMSAYTWQLVGTDSEGNFLRVDVSPEELNQAVGTGYVPALGQRTFRLPIAGFGPAPIKITFKR